MRAGILSPCQPVADAGSVHSDAAELAYFRAWEPEVASVENVVRVAGMRWAIEESFEDAKGSVGLDQYEVRKWTAWYRHFTLTLMAHAYLEVTRRQGPEEEKGGRQTSSP
jgi:SRSO17 transposase